MRLRLILVLFVTLAAATANPALELREAWRFPAEGGIASPTFLRPTDTAPIAGIVFTVADGRLVCLDGRGRAAWTHPIAPLSHSAPAVGDVDGDGRNEVVALDADGTLFCLSAAGEQEWTAKLTAGTRDRGGPGLFDLDGDGAREIVVGDGGGKVWCFDGRGKIRWTADVGRRWFSMPAFADLDGDARPEILIGEVDHHFYCLTAEGEWLWEVWREDEVFGNSGATAADLTGDGTPEVLVGGGLNHFLALEGRTGRPVQEIDTLRHINSALAAADLEGDGQVDVVFGTRSGTVYRIGRQGEVIWLRQPGTFMITAVAIADLTGDANPEIVLAMLRQALIVLDAAGREVVRYPLDCSGEAPAIGDIDGDGNLEIVVSDKRGAEVLCLKTDAPAAPGAVRWESMRGDAACTGNPAGVHALRPQPIRPRISRGATFQVVDEPEWLCGANERVYQLANPDSRRLLLSVSVTRPDGAVARVFRHTTKPSARVNCPIFVDEPGDYRLRARLVDVDTGAVLQRETATATVDLLAADVRQAEETIAALERAGGALSGAPPDMAEYLRRARLQVQGELGRLTSARGRTLSPPEKVALIEEAEASRRSAGHTLALARFILSRPEAERGRAFALWPAFPWHRFEAASAAPPEARRGLELEVYRGEAESACVNITSFRGRAAAYRVQMGPMKRVGAEGVMPPDRLVLREAVEVSSTSRWMVADAWVPLNDAAAVTVGPWESRQVWLTVTARDVAPGEYVGQLLVSSVEPFPKHEAVEVRVRVWPIEIPSPGRLRFVNWVAAARGRGAFAESLVRQVLDHGVNVLPIGCPSARFDATGAPSAPIDYTALDATLQRYPDATFLFARPQARVSADGAAPFSEGWTACYRTYLAGLTRHLAARGVGYDRFLLYPVDEASLAGSEDLQELTDTARISKQIDPRLRVFANPSMGATIESLTELSHYVDVWCPSQELMDRRGAPLLDFFKQTGQEVWFYDARGESRTLSGIAFFRRQAWQAWHLGLQGMGFYAALATPDLAWMGPNPGSPAGYFDVLYPGREVMASKRYEGSRDGKEDFEAMVLLREAIAAAGAASPQAAEAERLLTVEAESLWQAINALDDRCEVMTDGSETEQVFERLRAFRRRVAELTVELRSGGEPREEVP